MLHEVEDKEVVLNNMYLKATASSYRFEWHGQRGCNKDQRLKAQVSQLYLLFCKSVNVYELVEM